MIFSSSHDHGPALSFFHTATITGQFYHFLKQPRSRACVIIFSSSHEHGSASSFFFFVIYILPRSRASFIIYPSSHEHGPALSFYTATITGQFYHFLKQPRSRACVIIFVVVFFLFFCFFVPPRSRARFPIFSCCLDHGPAYHFQAATITGLHYNVMYIYCLDHGKFRNRQQQFSAFTDATTANIKPDVLSSETIRYKLPVVT